MKTEQRCVSVQYGFKRGNELYMLQISYVVG